MEELSRDELNKLLEKKAFKEIYDRFTPLQRWYFDYGYDPTHGLYVTSAHIYNSTGCAGIAFGVVRHEL